MTRPAIACALALGLLGAAVGAGAHAFLDRADPRVGSTVNRAPSRVRLRFTGALEPAYSRVRVLDASGAQVDLGDARVDAADPSLLSVSLRPLAPGRYRVVWRVLSVDSHVTEGDYTFRVVP